MCSLVRGTMLMVIVGTVWGCGLKSDETAPVESVPQAKLGEAGAVGDADGFEDEFGDAGDPATQTGTSSATSASSSPSAPQAGIRATRTATTAAGVFVEEDRDEEDE
ncbi:MAG: hypothetical protein ABGZ17_13345 [Planctomycetaceae bacterium]